MKHEKAKVGFRGQDGIVAYSINRLKSSEVCTECGEGADQMGARCFMWGASQKLM